MAVRLASAILWARSVLAGRVTLSRGSACVRRMWLVATARNVWRGILGWRERKVAWPVIGSVISVLDQGPPTAWYVIYIHYIHTYIHTYIQTYIIYICTYIHTYTHIYTYTHMHTCIHTYIHTHTHTYTHTCIHTYIHTHTHSYIHTHTHTHTHKHTYTHTYKLLDKGPFAHSSNAILKPPRGGQPLYNGHSGGPKVSFIQRRSTVLQYCSGTSPTRANSSWACVDQATWLHIT